MLPNFQTMHVSGGLMKVGMLLVSARKDQIQGAKDPDPDIAKLIYILISDLLKCKEITDLCKIISNRLQAKCGGGQTEL